MKILPFRLILPHDLNIENSKFSERILYDDFLLPNSFFFPHTVYNIVSYIICRYIICRLYYMNAHLYYIYS